MIKKTINRPAIALTCHGGQQERSQDDGDKITRLPGLHGSRGAYSQLEERDTGEKSQLGENEAAEMAGDGEEPVPFLGLDTKEPADVSCLQRTQSKGGMHQRRQNRLQIPRDMMGM